jgi:hypothetical protein
MAIPNPYVNSWLFVIDYSMVKHFRHQAQRGEDEYQSRISICVLVLRGNLFSTFGGPELDNLNNKRGYYVIRDQDHHT